MAKNLIYGEKPEFGNPKHIEFIQRIDRIFNHGQEVSTIDWDILNKKGEYAFHPEDGSKLIHKFECPRCQSENVISSEYDYCEQLWYQTLIEIDNKLLKTTLKCNKCKQKFFFDDKDEVGEVSIYIKKK